MRRSTLVIAGLAASLVAACASTPETVTRRAGPAPVATASSTAPVHTPTPTWDPLVFDHLIALDSGHQKIGDVYDVAGRRYQPERNDYYDEVGIASWYGPQFHGRLTANGEIFDQDAMTAAHTTLPIPSIAEITNMENGRTVIVRINDRGPFVDDRIIDLSRAAATELGYIGRGLAEVRVRYLGPAHATGPAPDRIHRADSRREGGSPPPIEIAAVDPLAGIPQNAVYEAPMGQSVTLQVGAFSDRGNANRFAARLEEDGEVWIEPGATEHGLVYRVFFGRWDDRRSAFAAQSVLTERGVYESRIIALD